MAGNALDDFAANIRAHWGPLSSDVVELCRADLLRLIKADDEEPWLAQLQEDRPAYQELHRDEGHGFVLLAHTEQRGLYRPPHDHGRGWVIYAIQRGAIEMGSYVRIVGPDGDVRLVKRGSTVVCAGEVQVYLPGDIHDTRCISESALLFRFTERDLKKEDREEHRVTRYVERDGRWTVGGA